MASGEIIRVYVGTDRSQALAVSVLEYSIKRHTKATVEVIPLLDLAVPKPRNPRNEQRTGFSFCRFCIPKLAGYQGKAIYMDADMQVFKDIHDLWSLPFRGAKVLIQEEVLHTDVTINKANAPKKREKQCSVMLLDCDNLNWEIDTIVQNLDTGEYDYNQLMTDLCILKEDEIGYSIPFEWNSLEYFDENTCLIHYTDMGTQPWVSAHNPNGHLWFAEVRKMLADGSLEWASLKKEVELGYFRPSLLPEIRYGHLVPTFIRKLFNQWLEARDKRYGFVPHKAVYDAKRARTHAVNEYERSVGAQKY
jgi:lipopolysaccharide biosynthesis glycosyltransferase